MGSAQQLQEPHPIESRPLRNIDFATPEPDAGEMMVEVAACGVCRTDLQLIEGDLAPRSLPIVPGHQVVGRVAAVGEGVERWRRGDRAGVGWLAGVCGTCARCRSGEENLCAQAEFTGWDRDGGFATSMLVRAGFAYPIPPSFGDVEAAPLLCGGVIGYRALKVSGIEPGQRLGLYGFGASALLTIQVAVAWGCEVFVTTRSRAEQARAIELGASWSGPYSASPPQPLDAAITFAPVGYVVVEALKALREGGTVAVNAIHLDSIPEFPYELLWGERGVRSVANFTRTDAEEYLRLAAEIPVRTFTDAHPLVDANLALARVKRGDVDGAAVLTV